MIPAKQLPKQFLFEKNGATMTFACKKNGNYSVCICGKGYILFHAKNQTKEQVSELSSLLTTVGEMLNEIPSFLAHRDDV